MSKNLIFEPFWARFAQILKNENFFQKSGSVTFLNLSSPNFMQGKYENLRYGRTDRRTDGPEFIGPFRKAGVQNVHCKQGDIKN